MFFSSSKARRINERMALHWKLGEHLHLNLDFNMKMLASGVIVIHVDLGFLADWHEPYFPYIIDKGMFGLVFISSI